MRIVEKEDGAIQTDTMLIWCKDTICEERDATELLRRRYFDLGFLGEDGRYYFVQDHLASLRQLTDQAGQISAAYAYDPFGRANELVGNVNSGPGFTAHYIGPAGLDLALYRAYDPDLGRWLSQDPIGAADGLNLYAYVKNGPTVRLDPLGLKGCTLSPEGSLLLPAYSFTSACDAHDNCYGTCGKSKEACDDRFCRDLGRKCDELSGWRVLFRSDCKTQAALYCAAVKVVGKFWYDKAQETACKCSAK